MKKSSQFYFLLTGAFCLEMSAYLAFPYISLQMRERFLLSPERIGQILMLAIWIRPLAALAGGILATRLRPLILFAMACACESACYLLLGSAHHAALAILAIFLGNIGFSIWKPSIFALSYDDKNPKAATSRLALLEGVFSGGAAFGCLLSAFLVHRDIAATFLVAGVLYILLIPLFIPILHGQKAEGTADSGRKTTSFRRLMRWETVAIIAVSVGFWASYSQFNLFFSLFAADWLHHPSLTGEAFALVTLLVAIFSLALSRWSSFSKALPTLAIFSTILFALGWAALSFVDIAGVVLFVVSISIGESLFAVLLANAWGGLIPGKKHLMQSLNFSFRGVSMGIGGLLGGEVYQYSSHQASLVPWAGQNAALLMVSLAGLIFLARRKPAQNMERPDFEETTLQGL